MDVIIDVSNYSNPAVHPVVYALTDPTVGLPTLLPLPTGTKVGVHLPPGLYDGFNINANLYFTPELDSAGWGDIEINLIGPYAPRGTAKQVMFEDIGADVGPYGDTISVFPKDTYRGRFRMWSCELRVGYRAGFGHSNKQSTPSEPKDYGHTVGFHQCDFRESPTLVAAGSYNPKWAIHSFFTSPWVEECVFNVPGLEEHAVYAHSQMPYRSGMKNCLIESVGGQVWQEVARNTYHEDPNASVIYSGPWQGSAKTVIVGNESHSGFHKGTRPGFAITVQSTGRDIVIKNNIFSDLDPNDTDNNDSPRTYAAVNVSVGGQWQASGLTPVWDSQPKLADGGEQYHNKSVKITGNVFAWRESLTEMVSVSSVLEDVIISDNAFLNDNGRPMLLAENGDVTNGSVPYYLGTGDLARVHWFGNNTPALVNYAASVVPGLTPAELASNPVVLGSAAKTYIDRVTGNFDMPVDH